MSGRPRDPAVDGAIRRATLELAEELGPRGVSIDGIAARSGVAKQTIYRRYQNKGELLLATLGDRVPTPDTGTLRDDLVVVVVAAMAAQYGLNGVLRRALVGEALQTEPLAGTLRDQLLRPWRTAVLAALARARARGEIAVAPEPTTSGDSCAVDPRPSVGDALAPDDEVLVDLVLAPLWYRLLFGRGDTAYPVGVAAMELSSPADGEYAGRLADAVVAAARGDAPALGRGERSSSLS
jgi:AcrR family transcriptional regulator